MSSRQYSYTIKSDNTNRFKLGFNGKKCNGYATVKIRRAVTVKIGCFSSKLRDKS